MACRDLQRPNVLGVWPAHNAELRAGLLEALANPNGLTHPVTELQYGRWTHGDNCAVPSHAELAAIRWQHVDYASQGGGRRLANAIRKEGFSALAFMGAHGAVKESQARIIGLELALDMELDLRGGIYLLPWPDWSPDKAAAIERDADAEIAVNRQNCAAWPLCAERNALFDYFERTGA